MTPIVERALEVADRANKDRKPGPSLLVEERFFALDVLSIRVRELEGLAPTPPKACHCRSTWEDFETNRLLRFRMTEIEKMAGELIDKVNGRKGQATIPDSAVEVLKSIEKKARAIRIGSAE